MSTFPCCGQQQMRETLVQKSKTVIHRCSFCRASVGWYGLEMEWMLSCWLVFPPVHWRWSECCLVDLFSRLCHWSMLSPLKLPAVVMDGFVYCVSILLRFVKQVSSVTVCAVVFSFQLFTLMFHTIYAKPSTLIICDN